jgi:hypothetical protein
LVGNDILFNLKIKKEGSMKIQFLKPIETNANVKATVHINGKMGFSKSAIKKFGLDEGKFIKIGVNTEDESDKNLYVIVKNFDDGESLKIHKAGQYYYVNSKPLFDNLGIDYKNMKIIFDVEDFEYSNIKMHKFVKREIDRSPVGKKEAKGKSEPRISIEPEAQENVENDTPQP